MKWMMPSVGVLVAAVLSGSVAAQSSGTAANGGKMDKMAMKDTTYIGCVEAGGAPGAFTLSHLAADDHMGKDAMKQDAMKQDTMKKDTMTKDCMSRDAMAPSTWALASSAVDLSKHLGHTVTVTGSPAQGKMDAMGRGAPAFTATSLKMVAASCP
jgi:pentapeptide MXKDX repeat protein